MGIIAEKYSDLNSEKDTPIKSYVNGKQCKKNAKLIKVKRKKYEYA